jgi:hypothetical protein
MDMEIQSEDDTGDDMWIASSRSSSIGESGVED